MGRSLGVANSTADIDGGTITGATVSSNTLSGNTITGGSATALTSLGVASGGTVGVYGKVPVAQRAYSSAVHATASLVTSTGSLFVASHLAAIQEIQLTLIGLGVWATA
jgi:hypothetical protein